MASVETFDYNDHSEEACYYQDSEDASSINEICELEDLNTPPNVGNDEIGNCSQGCPLQTEQEANEPQALCKYDSIKLKRLDTKLNRELCMEVNHSGTPTFQIVAGLKDKPAKVELTVLGIITSNCSQHPDKVIQSTLALSPTSESPIPINYWLNQKKLPFTNSPSFSDTFNIISCDYNNKINLEVFTDCKFKLEFKLKAGTTTTTEGQFTTNEDTEWYQVKNTGSTVWENEKNNESKTVFEGSAGVYWSDGDKKIEGKFAYEIEKKKPTFTITYNDFSLEGGFKQRLEQFLNIVDYVINFKEKFTNSIVNGFNLKEIDKEQKAIKKSDKNRKFKFIIGVDMGYAYERQIVELDNSLYCGMSNAFLIKKKVLSIGIEYDIADEALRLIPYIGTILSKANAFAKEKGYGGLTLSLKCVGDLNFDVDIAGIKPNDGSDKTVLRHKVNFEAEVTLSAKAKAEINIRVFFVKVKGGASTEISSGAKAGFNIVNEEANLELWFTGIYVTVVIYKELGSSKKSTDVPDSSYLPETAQSEGKTMWTEKYTLCKPKRLGKIVLS